MTLCACYQRIICILHANEPERWLEYIRFSFIHSYIFDIILIPSSDIYVRILVNWLKLLVKKDIVLQSSFREHSYIVWIINCFSSVWTDTQTFVFVAKLSQHFLLTETGLALMVKVCQLPQTLLNLYNLYLDYCWNSTLKPPNTNPNTSSNTNIT